MTQQFQKFVNRKIELKFLEKEYQTGHSNLDIIYGRRRIGKSELILKFIENKNAIYYACSTEGDEINIEELKKRFSPSLKDPNFSLIKFKSWYSLFSSLVNHKNFPKNKKVIIVLDEFPYLIISNPHIPSIFQKIWDEILRKENIMLILCGSYISIMERRVIAKKSPLYGRRTASFLLNSLDFIYLEEFLPYSTEDLINSWSVIGGVPAYLQKFDQELSFWENLKNFITKGSYFYEEAEILLRDEFREPRNYKLILKAISFGYRTLGKICSFTYLDKSMVSKYLEVLKEVKIIQERIPVTETKRFKGRLYEIIDPYFNFWFRFVYSNKIDLEARREDIVLESIKKEFPNYIGRMFEFLIEELIRKRYLLENFSFTKIGKQWGKIPKASKNKNQYEIDIVALNDQTKDILFAECKWQSKVNAEKVVRELAEKASYVDWHKEKRKESYAIFAKSFSKKIKKFEGRKVFCFDLKDLEKTLKIKKRKV